MAGDSKQFDPIPVAMGFVDHFAEQLLVNNPVGVALYGKVRPRIEGVVEDVFRPVEKKPARGRGKRGGR